jgi:flagellar biosynthetic protein FliP
MSLKTLISGLFLLIVMVFVVPNNTELNAQTTAPTQPTVGNTVAPTATQIPKIDLSISPIEGKEDYSVAIQVLILLTVLSFGPAFVTMMTSFTRLIVVFGFLRQALGTQQSPPTQVMVGVALFLTIYIMSPVMNDIQENAVTPYLEDQITQSEALDRASVPIKRFMLKQTREKDLLLFMDMSGTQQVNSVEDMPLFVVVPAFVISELRIAFEIGFLLFLPFLVIDLVVSSILLAMGIMFLPPVTVSLPFKILVFVLTDGWYLIVESMMKSFN